MSARTTTVVLGARTRLGEAVVPALLAAGDDVVLLARHDDDALALRERHGGGVEVAGTRTSDEPSPRIVAGDVLGATLGRSQGPLRVLVLALGPAHPTDPHQTLPLEKDMRDVNRDLDVLATALDAGARHVVLVSTVIALAPQYDRRYYGGWKAVVEQTARELAERRGAALTAVHPGRLVERRSGLGARLSTTYAKLARVVLATDPTSTTRVVGIDSRIWLVSRSIQLLGRSLFPTSSRRRPLSQTRVEGHSPGGSER